MAEAAQVSTISLVIQQAMVVLAVEHQVAPNPQVAARVEPAAMAEAQLEQEQQDKETMVHLAYGHGILVAVAEPEQPAQQIQHTAAQEY